MIPAVDVQFLRTITARLKEQRALTYKPGNHRSAAALILRFAPSPSSSGSHSSSSTSTVQVSKLFSRFDQKLSADEVLSRLAANQIDERNPATHESLLHLLFLKKADMSADRWSGQIAFPGGLRDPDDADDFATVVREAREELGIPLDAPDFIYLGRMVDYAIQSRHVHLEGLTQARFVFLHIGDMTPTTVLARHEVESVQWFPISRLAPQFVDRRQVVHHILNFAHVKQVRRMEIIKEFFPGALLCFPSVALPQESGCSWRIWGLTLRSASELLELQPTRKPLDWPPYESTSFLFQHGFINPYLGYRLLTEPHLHPSTRDPYLFVSLAGVVGVFIAAIYGVSYALYALTTAVLMVFDMLDPDQSIARKKEYYEQAYIPTADQSMARSSDYRHSNNNNAGLLSGGDEKEGSKNDQDADERDSHFEQVVTTRAETNASMSTLEQKQALHQLHELIDHHAGLGRRVVSAVGSSSSSSLPAAPIAVETVNEGKEGHLPPLVPAPRITLPSLPSSGGMSSTSSSRAPAEAVYTEYSSEWSDAKADDDLSMEDILTKYRKQ